MANNLFGGLGNVLGGVVKDVYKRQGFDLESSIRGLCRVPWI